MKKHLIKKLNLETNKDKIYGDSNIRENIENYFENSELLPIYEIVKLEHILIANVKKEQFLIEDDKLFLLLPESLKIDENSHKSISWEGFQNSEGKAEITGISAIFINLENGNHE